MGYDNIDDSRHRSQLFLNGKDFFTYLTDFYLSTDWEDLVISTYGLRLPDLNFIDPLSPAAQDPRSIFFKKILENLGTSRLKNLRFLIGTQEERTDKLKRSIADIHERTPLGTPTHYNIVKLFNLIEVYPSPTRENKLEAIVVRCIPKHHLKLFLFKRGPHIRVFAGGLNFTGSGWNDAMFGLTNQQALDMYQHVRDLSHQGTLVDYTNVKSLKDQCYIRQMELDAADSSGIFE